MKVKKASSRCARQPGAACAGWGRLCPVPGGRHPPLDGAAVVTLWGLQRAMQSACQLLEAVVRYEIVSCKRTFIERQRPIWLKAMQDGVHRCCAVHQGGAEVWCARWVGAGTLCGVPTWPQGPRTGLQGLQPVILWRCVTGLGQERPVAADESRLSTPKLSRRFAVAKRRQSGRLECLVGHAQAGNY